ncbi:MAG: LysR family transcriptional regulator [Hyphomicrobiaceae bacterium]
MTNILDVPPRLLQLFVDLCETSSISRSADNLRLSQPAASRGLALLRDALDEPLLVRSGRGLAVTPSALRLLPQVRAILRQIERLPIASGAAIADMEGVVRIATTDYGAVAAIGPALQTIEQAAPRLALEVVPLDDQVFQKLQDGRVDVALYADDPTPAGICHADLFREEHVYAVARNHPLARRRRLTKEMIETFPRLLVTIIGDRQGYVDDGSLGGAQPGLWIPYFTAAPLMLTQSEMVMALPRRAAEALRDTAGLAILSAKPPAKPFTYRLLWAEEFADDPVIAWLRCKLIEALA